MVPANLGAHMFWTEVDPERKAAKRRDFLTDISLLGGLVIASADTPGKPSLGWRGRRAAARLTDSVVGGTARRRRLRSGGPRRASRLQEGLQAGAERGRELAAVAADEGAPLLEAARDAGPNSLSRREHGRNCPGSPANAVPIWRKPRRTPRHCSEAARERGAELAHAALGQGDELATEARKRARAWRRH